MIDPRRTETAKRAALHLQPRLPRVLARHTGRPSCSAIRRAGSRRQANRVGTRPAATVVAADVRYGVRYGVRAIGVAEGVKERFYAITLERRIKHPGIAAIAVAARERLFQ